ncbi:hypothetical protein PMZ80_004519 [Knufia obscura]|nr:hypothetical protein PMZ80_004519 [Knufia obscura]
MDAKNSLFDLARPSFQQQDSINFNESWAYSPTGVRSCLNEGQAGYWGFSPFFYCVDGTLSGCSGDDYPSDGAVVRFCAPKTLGGANPSAADGALNVVQCGGCEPEMAPANATLTEEESEALTEGEGESTDGSTSLGVAVSKSISAIALAVIVGLGLCL